VPLYEYQCDRDGRFELIQKFSDPPLKVCPKCGGPVQRLLSAPAIQFKGTGWYVTDYARKSEGDGSKGKEESAKSGTEAASAPAYGESSGASGKSDSGKSETPKKAATASSKKDK
jgi:putative FmdB family regulatory protein